MKNIIRILTLLSISLVSSMTNATNSYLRWGNTGSVEVSDIFLTPIQSEGSTGFDEVAKYEITTSEKKLECRGADGLGYTRNIMFLNYEFIWQYRVENGAWKDLHRVSGQWESGTPAPEMWGGSLKKTDDWTYPIVKGKKLTGNIDIKDYKEKASILVQSRFVWHLYMHVEGDSDNKSLDGESSYKECYLYRCSDGKIGMAEKTTIPSITDNLYAIYDHEDYKKNHYIQIKNTSYPIGKIDTSYFVKFNGTKSKSLEMDDSYPYQTNNISVFDFETKNDLLSEETFTVQKKYIVNQSVYCTSNTIYFDHFDPILLVTPEFYKENQSQHICTSNNQSTITLAGCQAKITSKYYKEKQYGLVYQWEMSLDKHTWVDVPDENDINLHLTGSFVSSYTKDKPIYFRPKVYLARFDYTIRPAEEIVYEVIPYTVPTLSNLKLSLSDNKICANDEFDVDKGFITLSQKYASDIFNPSAIYSINPSATRIDEEDLNGEELAKWKIEDKLSDTTTYTITINDAACGSDPVEFQATIKVENVITNPEADLKIDNCTYDFENGRLKIKVKEGSSIKFTSNSKKYNYVLQYDETTKEITSFTTISLKATPELEDKNITLHKVNVGINSNGCEGETIPVEIQTIKEITGNHIECNSCAYKDGYYYVCKGDSNPFIVGSEDIEGGYGDMSFKWKKRQSTDADFTQIPNSENETFSLSKGIFKITGNCEIVRIIEMGDGTFESVSDTIKIKVYSNPSLSLVKDEVDSLTVADICYKEAPSFNVSPSSDEPNFTERLGDVTYNITTSTIDTSITVNSKYNKWSFTEDGTISASQKFCGSNINAFNKLALNVKEDLSFGDNNFIYQCPILGKEMDITPLDPNDKSAYIYKVGTTTFNNNLGKVGTSTIKLPTTTDGVINDNSQYVNATITRLFDGCSVKKEIRIKNVLVPLEDRKLILEKSIDGTNIGCQEKEYKITDNHPVDEENVIYTWNSKTGTKIDPSGSQANIILDNADMILRKRTLGGVCEVKVDTITIGVLAKSTSKPSINLSSTELCNEEELTIKIDPIEGYKITSFEKNGTPVKLFSDNLLTEITKSSGNVTYSVEMTSEKCDNYVLNGKKTINVAPDLEIHTSDITVSPTYISKNLFDEDKKYITIELTDNKYLGQDTVSFRLNDKIKKALFTEDGYYSTFSFNVSELYDENGDEKDNIEAEVYRSYKLSKTKTCYSHIHSINIPIKAGFENIVINAEGKSLNAEDIFYFCDNGKLQLTNDEIIFNNKTLDPSEYKLQWYKKTYNDWNAIKNASDNELEITTTGLENRSDFYKLIVSTTINNKVYKQSSNVIEVRNMANPNLNIHLTDGDMNFCYAGAIDFELQTTTWSTPNGVVEAKNTYTWQKSIDGITWTDLKKNTTEDTVNINTKNDVSTLSYSENAMKNTTYFRAVLTDLCDKTAISNTLLTKVDKNLNLTSKDISVLSNSLVKDKKKFEVKFYVKNSDDTKYSYVYYNEDGDPIEGMGTAMQIFSHNNVYGDSHTNFDYTPGKHKVYVEKEIIGTGCKSNMIEVEYEIIEPLIIEIEGHITNSCPNNSKQRGELQVYYNEGGFPDNTMTAHWYYRYEDEENFHKIDETTDDFEFSIKDNDDGNIINGRIFNINNLDRTCLFYAEITNDGYPLKSVRTSAITLNIKPKFKISRAKSDKSQYCYGDIVELYAGDIESSYGNVTIKWDDLNSKKIYPEENNLILNGIYEQTTFRRIAYDECKTMDTFDINLPVRDKLSMTTDEYVYTPFEENGHVPYIAVNSDSLQKVKSYIVSHIKPDGFIDKSEEIKQNSSSLIFSTMPEMYNSLEKYMIYKTDNYGCRSVPDTFSIVGIDMVNAGIIAFESYGDAKSINICHGQSIGKIVDEEVASGGDSIEFKWYYGIAETNDIKTVVDNNIHPISSSTFNADTINFGHIVTLNTDSKNNVKTYFLYRTVTVNVAYPEGTKKSEPKKSNILYINVAPTLSSCNIEDLAGSINTQQSVYCEDTEISEFIYHSVNDDIKDRYEAKDFGALQFGDEKNLYGYWEESKDNKNFTKVTDAEIYENGFESNRYRVKDLEGNTYIRFTLYDGCTTLSTTSVALNVLNFDDDNIDNYVIKAKNQNYIEEGDNVTISNIDDKIDHKWFSWKKDNGLISEKDKVVLDSITTSTHLYHKRIRSKNNVTCIEPGYFEVPLDVHRISKGGRIKSSQQICPGEEFADIKNYESPSGGSGKFQFRWEITTDSSEACNCWNQIDNAFADTLNYATYRKVLDNKKVNYIRRTATPIYNDKEVNNYYTRYSNVIVLETYKPLKVSDIKWKDDFSKNSYCAEEHIPDIQIVSPTGGSAEYKNSRYDLDWMYSIDNTNWILYKNSSIAFGDTSEINGDGLVYSYFENKKRDQDVTFYIKAIFKDESCGFIESEPFSFKVWAEPEDPKLYIAADSCNAKYITFKLESTKFNYLYNWTMETDSLNPMHTGFEYQYELDIARNTEAVHTGYSVQGKRIESQCTTNIIYFDVDSLPALKQSPITTQESILCYGADLKIEQEAATGGTGEKSYLWQYSFDNDIWNDAITTKDFLLKNVKKDIYVRRIVFTDACPDTIVSESALYKVADKVNPLNVSIEENICRNQDMLVSITDSIPNNCNIVIYRLGKNTTEEIELSNDIPSGKIEGNNLSENIFGVVTWDSTHSCKSEMIEITRRPRPDFTGVSSSIESETNVVCKGSSVAIKSSSNYSLPEFLKQRFESSKDGNSWDVVKECNTYNKDYKLTVYDTIYYRTIISNGCNDSLVSNSIKIASKETLENPIKLQVTTSSNGEIIIDGYNNKDNVSLYMIVNDSIEYDFNEQITLGKETEKVIVNTKLSVDENLTCYSPIFIKPLKKGNIFVECNSTGKQIVGEEVYGAGEGVYYEWYKYDKKNLMMYLTDITEKNYMLSVDDEKSKLVRFSYFNDGNIKYLLKSNELTISTNGPSLSRITLLEEDSLIKQNLTVSDYCVRLNVGMDVTLSCFIDDAESGEWQSSLDGKSWKSANKFQTSHLSDQTLKVTPIVPMYYRVVATNYCGTTSSDSMFVVIDTIPAITEGCIETTFDNCEKIATIICYDDESKNYKENYYKYSYEVIGTYNDKIAKGNNGITIKGISGEIEVIITKSYNGVSTKYTKRIDMSKSISASFSIIADNIEYGSDKMKAEWLDSVYVIHRIFTSSGTKIQLKNRSTNGISYNWDVYYDGIKMATSTIENPQLYVYNTGSYSFYLTTYSGKCQSKTEWIDGIYVQPGSFKSANISENSDFIIYPEFKEANNHTFETISHISVFPSLVYNLVNIESTDKMVHTASLVDNFGRILHTTEFKGAIQIPMDEYIEGVYFIVVDGNESFKIIKK